MSVDVKRQLAVALHYDKKGAPRVVAKGKGAIGAKIIEVARAHDIPIEENEVLAGALSHVEIGDEIPNELYKAVAEVLIFVLRLTGQNSAVNLRKPRQSRHRFTTMPSASFRPASTLSDTSVINRRHALGLVAAATCCPPAASPMSPTSAASFAMISPSGFSRLERSAPSSATRSTTI